MAEQIQYTASSEKSSEALEDILSLYLSSSKHTMTHLDLLLQDDPEMPMAHLLRGYLLKLASDPRFNKPAAESLQTALTFNLNRREQMHGNALQEWFAGDTVKAAEILEQLLAEFPRDALALRLAHHLHFYSGDASAMRDSVDRAAKHYAPEDRHYSYVLGMQSFGSEEAGDYEVAEQLGRRAVELEPKDQWATHAVAHVMQMQSRFTEGVEWLTLATSQWQDCNNFLFHIYWHQALFELGNRQPERALEIYDRHLIAPLSDDFYLDVCNASSLLWRLEMSGLDVGDRWQALSPYSHRTSNKELVFCTLHYLLTPARLGDKQKTAEALEQLQQWGETDSSQGQVVTTVGKPLAEAVCLLSEGKFQQASAAFQSAQSDLHLIGGSHAQRHLFRDMQYYAEQQIAN